MATYLCVIALVASSVFCQVSPGSAINSSSPCVGGHPTMQLNGTYSFPYTNYITIYKQADIDAISNCTSFIGSLLIDPTFEGDVFMPNLISINGGLMAWNRNLGVESSGNLTGLIFPKLEDIILNRTYFTNSSTPSTWVDPLEGIIVENITSIQTIWLPSLYNFTGELFISNLPGLTNLSTFSMLDGQRDVFGENGAVNYFQLSDTNVSSFLMNTLFMKDILFSENPQLMDHNLNAITISSLTVSATNIMLGPYFDGPLDIGNLDISRCQNYYATILSKVGGNFNLHDTNVLSAPVTLPVQGDLIVVNNAELKTLTFSASIPNPSDTTQNITSQAK